MIRFLAARRNRHVRAILHCLDQHVFEFAHFVVAETRARVIVAFDKQARHGAAFGLERGAQAQ
jgi:hypothetical protein